MESALIEDNANMREGGLRASGDAAGICLNGFPGADEGDVRPSDLQADVKIIIHNPQTGNRLAFGPGVAEICRGVREHGSLAAAAKQMGMSYSKAWKIVGEAEEALRMKLVMRQKPKGCWLTPVGEKLLDGYLAISNDVAKYAEFRFKDAFPPED